MIGSVIIPHVPADDQLAVSNAIVWNQSQIPPPDHYCLIAVVDNTFDPGPELVGFLNRDNFERFIRENNNVMLRHFNVKDKNIGLS